MDTLPTTLTHFFRPSKGPFRSITELAETDATEVCRQMTKDDDTFDRFTAEHRDHYMRARRRSEARLYDAFVKKGGKPKRRCPYYLFLDTPGTETFFPEQMRLVIPLNSIPASVVSFTYLDSMCCDAILEKDPEGMLPTPFVARFSDLLCLSRSTCCQNCQPFCNSMVPRRDLIEAQVWDDEPLEPYRKANHTPGNAASPRTVLRNRRCEHSTRPIPASRNECLDRYQRTPHEDHRWLNCRCVLGLLSVIAACFINRPGFAEKIRHTPLSCIDSRSNLAESRFCLIPTAKSDTSGSSSRVSYSNGR